MSSVNPVGRSSGWSGLFWQAFRRSKNAMVLVDEHRCHVEVNGAYLQLLGYPRESLIGRPIYELIRDGPLVSREEFLALLGQPQFTGVATVIAADGGLLRVEFAGHPEVVTGQKFILGVVLKAARATRRFRDDAGPSGRTGSLSARELEIIRLIALGWSGPEIAGELHIAHNTVRSHTRNSMEKMGARSRAQLVAKCLGEGLLWGESASR